MLRSDRAGGDGSDGTLLAGGPSTRLFGRLRESSGLADAFARVSATGRSEVVLISGPPGIGKSALVHRFRSLLRTGRHRFAEGKSEHSQIGAALAPVVQTLHTLVDQVLGESDEVLAGIRARLAGGLGQRGRLVTDLLPEAAALLGPTAPQPDLPALLAQTRLQRALIATLAAFAEPGQPLVLFFDDLQWADSGTLGVLAAFAKEPPGNVLLLASYRDEGADALCAPDGLVTALRHSEVPLGETALSPLTLAATTEVIAHALTAPAAEIAALAESIQAQARGNPFFTEHFLRRLLEGQVLRRDGNAGPWIWDDRRLAGETTGGDVLDFMAERLARLHPDQRRVLAALAALGGRAETALLALLLAWRRRRVEEEATDLTSLGLLKLDGSFCSVPHDRILEAASLLTSEADRPAIHARIARILIATRRRPTPEQLSEIAGHLLRVARAAETVTLPARRRLRFATVLRDAAVRMRQSGALDQAVAYLDAAARLQQHDWWSSSPGLAFDLAFLRCESLLLRGDVSAADEGVGALLARDLRPRDRAATFRLLAGLRTVQSEYDQAIAAALAGLDLMGHPLKQGLSLEDCLDASARIRALIGDGPDDAVLELPSPTTTSR